ncbi:MAG: glycosyltransferase family 2 protein [Bacteroidota bacterium]|nr:glycosyltransferase family 2 protein [Bacteroidota bacterium]
MIYIIIPVYNRKDNTRKCLKSLEVQSCQNFRIVVVNDGSTDGTDKMLNDEFPYVDTIVGDGNLWWTKATNNGIKWVLNHKKDARYILTLNNDTILPENYIEKLYQSIDLYPNSIIGSLALDDENRDKIVEAGVFINWKTAKYSYPYQDQSIQTLKQKQIKYCTPTVISGRGTLIALEIFNKIGLFDEEQFPHYGADYDFSLRAKKFGYNLIVNYELMLYSFPKLSGLANTTEKVKVKDFIKSLSSIRSGNNLNMRLRFAFRHAPHFMMFSFIFIDFTRVIFGTLVKRTRIFNRFEALSK